MAIPVKPPNLKKQSVYLFTGKILAFFIKMAAPIILVRLLTQEAYGIYSQFNLITNTFLPILGLGFGSSLFYFFPRFTEDDRKILLGQTFLVLCGMGVIFLFLYTLFGLWIHKLLGVNSLDQFQFLIAVYVLFMLVSNLSNYVFTVQKEIRYNLYYFPTDVLVRTILLIGFILFIDYNYSWVYALLLYSIIRMLFMSKYLAAEISASLKSFKKHLVRQQLSYSLPFAGAIIITVISSQFDKLIINNYITTAEFAIYSIAFLSLPLINELIQSTQSVIVPKLSEYFQNDQIKLVSILWKKAVTNIASLAIPIIIFFGTVADDLFILLYTEQYSQASTLFRIYLVCYFFKILLWAVIFRASNNTDKIFYIDMITMPFIVAFGFIFIKDYGLLGGVYAALLGQILPIAIKLIYEKRIMKVNLRNWFEWGKLAKIIVSSIIPAVVIYFFIISNIDSVFLTLFVSAIIFFPSAIIIEIYFNVFMYKDELLKHTISFE